MKQNTITIDKAQFEKINRLVGELNRIFKTISGDKPDTPLYWSGSKSDLVELAYGILETKRFNDGDIDIQEAVRHLSEIFSIPIQDCYDVFRAIRRRTDSRTLYLDEMKARLNQRMDDMDNGIFKKRWK
ncbi:hypothetical protein M2451_002685 [Dysgonomonas sp. PFB1-18]|uniref:RteC domain-containing protein n=1 Tax=unclassified Dysgonomonas TaxID=2630389 RepID=UPI002473367B|nr:MULTISPECIES: RteC domain-containing protein [unclassified Dysgonomonas]MDH6309429.1 hypothetical protein [Dysgonomonas sp. PF1-14]MDH6339706.1 hypothetical protein [Dysgonomonas sp. PF1-16]MDH6381354.1 hypothetical protein [Dysgonomonas sp. PFB1-18]MDH6398569.1 hypothetical protein [Dysgonomonas sp. PF1-23]